MKKLNLLVIKKPLKIYLTQFLHFMCLLIFKLNMFQGVIFYNLYKVKL